MSNFFNVDKSPLANFAKKGLFNLALISAVALPTSGVLLFSQQPASAQSISNVPTNRDDIQNQAVNFWWNYYRRPWTQYYIGNFTPQQTSNINSRFGNQAPAQFNYHCRTSYYNAIGLSKWSRPIVEPFAWFFFPSRQEGDRVNCYMRRFN